MAHEILSTMNPATKWRFDLAKKIAYAYSNNPKTEVVMVAGSVGRGTADEFSDIEIDVYYSAAPTEEERVSSVRSCGAELKCLDEDDIEWEEQMEFSGFPAHTSTFLVSTMEDFLDRVINRCDPDEDAQLRLYSVQHSVPVAGQSLAFDWKSRADAYPDGLTLVMLERNLDFGRLFSNVDMLLARGDILGLYDAIVDAEKRLVRAMLGLNRIYLPVPEPIKRLDEIVDEMDLKPPDFAHRLKRILLDAPDQGLKALEELILEVDSLAALHREEWTGSIGITKRGLARTRRRW